jgi:hypothetical protein
MIALVITFSLATFANAIARPGAQVAFRWADRHCEISPAKFNSSGIIDLADAECHISFTTGGVEL